MSNPTTKASPDTAVITSDTTENQASDKGKMPYEEVEPWGEPVDLCALLDEIAECVQRHIVGEKEIAYASSLWIAMTYLVELFDVIALLIITAPELRCGKSEFRRLIGKMVFRPLEADNMSVAVLFRCYDMWHPTLLVDEYDTFVRKDEELRGVFNAGHQRGGCVWRCVGDKFEPTPFSVFGPKVLAGIGRLPPTLVDRGIILELRRKLPTETIVRQRDVPRTYFRTIQSKLSRMALDYGQAISVARPDLPIALSDRARDNWEPLFQIAQVAGGDWLKHAHNTALKLSGRGDSAKTVGVELLSDIQEAFVAKKVDRLSSADIVNFLCDDDERRWATYNKGFPITPTQVARRLREYGITSNTIRVHYTTAKGYLLKQFADAFARYVFADQVGSATAVTPSLVKTSETSSVTSGLPVTPPDLTRNEGVTCSANTDAGCDGVTASSDSSGSLSATPNQEIVLSEFQALLVQERLNSLINNQMWPEGIPLDDAVDQIQDKLVRVDQRVRRTMTGTILRQLVQMGFLVQYEGLLTPP